MKVFVSTSADLTPAIKKKLIVGNTLVLSVLTIEKPRPPSPVVGFVTKEIREKYAKKPPIIKIEKVEYKITSVEETKTGTLKSIEAKRLTGVKGAEPHRIPSGYGVPSVLTLSAKKLMDLVNTKLNKDDPKGSQSITLKAVTAAQSQKLSEHSKIDAEIAKLEAQKAELDKKINALAKIKSDERTKIEAEDYKRALDKLKADGYSYIQEIEGKRVKKRTLVEARNVNPGVGKKAAVYAVKDGKEQKILVWSAKDPITGHFYKGYMWFFTTKAAEKKFSVAM